ncbi:hypothetical protein BH18VER1_BH18VER1_06010 [soil metagenome]
MIFWRLLLLSAAAVAIAHSKEAPVASTSPDSDTPAASLIHWLLQRDDGLRELPFAEVIRAATGKSIVPINPADDNDARVLKAIGAGLDEVLLRMNAPDSEVQNVARINEISSFFEQMLREVMNKVPGLSCDFPKTADERVQRSGYPDLRLVDTETKRVYYMDPKLCAEGSRTSSFRTFYFEPKVATNKVRDDAAHLILGIEHSARNAGHWEFTRWDIVDLSKFRVKLKAEFQGSNRDIYRADAIVGSSVK